jgi:hypothetical protein
MHVHYIVENWKPMFSNIDGLSIWVKYFVLKQSNKHDYGIIFSLNSFYSEIHIFTSMYKQTKYMYNRDWETSQWAYMYVNLALIVLQLRGVIKFDAWYCYNFS